MKIISQGAEAIIYLKDSKIIKERVPKSYRAKHIDDDLRKKRTRKEAKVISEVSKIINSPKIISIDENKAKIEMEYIDGDKLRDVLEKKDYLNLCEQMGELVGKLHSKNIIHGDLTTSNMILKHTEIYLIDFGLSQHSDKTEDKAVDLHLLKRALESKHFRVWEKCFDSVIKGYKKSYKDADSVLKRLEIVEMRGRNKQKS